MSSPSQGAWECRHGVDGRDYCEECYAPSAASPRPYNPCPDCGADCGTAWETLKHMKHEHSSDHPGKEPAMVATAWELVWDDDE